jgi:hypothetical protein
MHASQSTPRATGKAKVKRQKAKDKDRQLCKTEKFFARGASALLPFAFLLLPS